MAIPQQLSAPPTGEAFIVPIDRRAKRFLTYSGLRAVQRVLRRNYNTYHQSDWPDADTWVQTATSQILDIAVRGTAPCPGTIGTVDQKNMPNSDTLIFVCSLRDWPRLGRQIHPTATLCSD